jgi:hypothetical protein
MLASASNFDQGSGVTSSLGTGPDPLLAQASRNDEFGFVIGRCAGLFGPTWSKLPTAMSIRRLDNSPIDRRHLIRG